MIRRVRLMMTMPVIVEIVDEWATESDLDSVFWYFEHVEKKFNFFSGNSETTKINKGQITEPEYSDEMREVLRLAQETKLATLGYFDIKTPAGVINPSGLVKGWAIHNAAKILDERGLKNFYVDLGGDIEVRGKNRSGELWCIGIKNPFNSMEIIKTLRLRDLGVATSGNYIRGEHIYNPKTLEKVYGDVVSLTVVGKNAYEADRFATAAFAMGKGGINFVEKMVDLEAYMIDDNGIATWTSGFDKLTK